MTAHAVLQPTTHTHLLPFYKRMREVGIRLNSKLVKSLSKQALHEGGRRLGILKENTFVFNSEDESSVLMDYCIYNCYEGGLNAVQRYLAETPPPADSDEMLLLRAQQNAYYALVQVTGVERGVGVFLRDTLRDEIFFLMDVSFGRTADVGAALATRVFPMDGFIMSTGASLPITPEAATRLGKRLERFHPADGFEHLTPAEEAEFAAATIRSCLETGASSHIAYAGLDERPSRQSPSRDQPDRVRANRNDKCPCGSGRKYKSCCGKRP